MYLYIMNILAYQQNLIASDMHKNMHGKKFY